ncbi:uncharacterized protein LOC144747481 [Ciona intestinalis]
MGSKESEIEINLCQPVLSQDEPTTQPKKPPNYLVASSLDNGNFILRECSLETLSGLNWLDGLTIDFYLNLIAKRKNVLVLDCFVVTSILDGKDDIFARHSLNKVNFCEYEKIVGGYNKNGNHWNLMYLNMAEKTFSIIEPAGLNKSCTTAIQRFRKYLQIRTNKKDKKLLRVKWNQLVINHQTQKDSFSCGIFVLKIAECLINDTNCSFSTNKDSLQNERQRIKKNIVDASDPPEDFCRLCGKNNSDVVMDWICCDKCSRWFHRICLGLEKPSFQALATESWLCCICT